jgi:hypothetical protein
MKQIKHLIWMFLLSITLASCGGGGGGDPFTEGEGGDGGGAAPTATTLSIATSLNSVASDNSEVAVITATALDANNAVLAGVTVNFSASGGQISAASAVTDATGQAKVDFSSGTSDPSNHVVTITATAGSLTKSIPVQVVGSSVTLTADSTNLVVGGTAANLTITAKDGSGAAVDGADVALSVAGAGAATLGATTGTTSADGTFKTKLTGVSPGAVTVTVTVLGATATLDFSISSPAAAFQITSPASNTATMLTSGSLTVTVSAPTQANVIFTTSHGVWDGGAAVKTVPVVGGVASAVLTVPSAGQANVQVTDAADSDVFDTLVVLASAPASLAASVTLQAEATTLGVSSGDTGNSTTLTATVRTSVATGQQPVAGAPVAFSISNGTGGGENVSPVFGITDSSGQVTATFTSGSLPTGQGGVTVTATVYGSGSAVIDTDSRSIVIAQSAGSVVMGYTNDSMQSVNQGTAYSLPVSVLVADSNGSAVANATVTISVWPEQYSTGYWVDDGSGANCGAVVTADFLNEDLDEDLIQDDGEDIPYSTTAPRNYLATFDGSVYSEDLNGDGDVDPLLGLVEAVVEDLDGDGAVDTFTSDGVLTPSNSAGGTAVAQVTTDASGIATFNLTYLKNRAVWIKDRIRATTTVQGTETVGTLKLRLPVLKEDAEECLVFNSPFNP